jgi:hypothetical protein
MLDFQDRHLLTLLAILAGRIQSCMTNREFDPEPSSDIHAHTTTRHYNCRDLYVCLRTRRCSCAHWITRQPHGAMGSAASHSARAPPIQRTKSCWETADPSMPTCISNSLTSSANARLRISIIGRSNTTDPDTTRGLTPYLSRRTPGVLTIH